MKRYSGALVRLLGPNPAASYLTTLHVLHVEAVLALLALLVLLLLAAALLDDAEAAGEDEQAGHHRDGDQRPWRNCCGSRHAQRRRRAPTHTHACTHTHTHTHTQTHAGTHAHAHTYSNT